MTRYRRILNDSPMTLGIESASVHSDGGTRMVVVRFQGQLIVLRVSRGSIEHLTWHTCYRLAESVGAPRLVASYLHALATHPDGRAFFTSYLESPPTNG
jgi:hypothetical protein